MADNSRYSEVLRRYNELGKFGINLGLKRIERLLENIGSPEKELDIIHIAGTNGKGSVSTMLMSILSNNGYDTGLFTSPFVTDLRESLQINGEMISEDEFADCGEFVLSHWENSTVEGEFPTQFEVLTAIALEWFKRRRCDFVCLEVGMGGKCDSTNAIPPPILQVITSIGLDHTSLLGSTVEEIAQEKAGIIKGGITVVYPLIDKLAEGVIQKKCKAVGSEFVKPDVSKLIIIDKAWRRVKFKYNKLLYKKKLSGDFQIYNAITAIEAAYQLRRLGIGISDEAILQGIAQAYLPARMEILHEKPLVILDGSHNVGGINALIKTLEQLKNRQISVVMGVLADKEYGVIVPSVAKYAQRFVAVEPNNPRKLDCEKLANLASDYCSEVHFHKLHNRGLEKALEGFEKDDALVVCGSLYLAADIRQMLIEKLENMFE